MDTITNFVQYALSKGYEAALKGNSIIIRNVKSQGNNFKIAKKQGYYGVFTLNTSRKEHEYLAKCLIYVLLAEYNKVIGTSTNLHLKFKVQLYQSNKDVCLSWA